MQVKLCLSTSPLYPIITMDDQYSLIQHPSSFSQLIHSNDFSRIMSKLQRLKQTKKPFNTQASIKTYQGHIMVFIESYIEENYIYVVLSNEKKSQS